MITSSRLIPCTKCLRGQMYWDKEALAYVCLQCGKRNYLQTVLEDRYGIKRNKTRMDSLR